MTLAGGAGLPGVRGSFGLLSATQAQAATCGVAARNACNCSIVRSRVASMSITILVMTSPRNFGPAPARSGSHHVGQGLILLRP